MNIKGPKPVFKEDVLEQLRHVDGCPAMVREIESLVHGIKQHLDRAADEIERLRPYELLKPIPGSYWIFCASSQAVSYHNGIVEIVRSLQGDEVDAEVGPMFECVSSVGLVHAFLDELSPLKRSDIESTKNIN